MVSGDILAFLLTMQRLSLLFGLKAFVSGAWVPINVYMIIGPSDKIILKKLLTDVSKRNFPGAKHIILRLKCNGLIKLFPIKSRIIDFKSICRWPPTKDIPGPKRLDINTAWGAGLNLWVLYLVNVSTKHSCSDWPWEDKEVLTFIPRAGHCKHEAVWGGQSSSFNAG